METDNERGPRETAYDETVSPLMTQIIAACKAAGIAFHCHFVLDGDLCCTSHLSLPEPGDDASEEEHENWRQFRNTYTPLARGYAAPAVAAFTITSTRPELR